ncbi:MAG: O-acetyl-ADP-ribose deacetylase [Acidobacteriota bacterium]|nr:O-acetyl-ADP-ribose deacetylase [Acidobacteriota bacterium]
MTGDIVKLDLGEGHQIFFQAGDITGQATDAIVNAANSSLMGGGGVDGAIHRAGGPAILEECKKIVAAQGHLPPGEAVSTTGGRLKAAFVIHTVGPVFRDGMEGEAGLLSAAYRNSLRLADRLGLQSIAFPAISTGVYGYPAPLAAEVAVRIVLDELSQAGSLHEVRFVLYSLDMLEIFVHAAKDEHRRRNATRWTFIKLPATVSDPHQPQA